MALVSLRTQSEVATECVVADHWRRRMRGLMGRAALGDGEALLIKPAPAVHTCFMRFPIDTVFLGEELEVLAVRENVKPWRAVGERRAKAVLELAAGESAQRDIRVGDRLELRNGD